MGHGSRIVKGLGLGIEGLQDGLGWLRVWGSGYRV